MVRALHARWQFFPLVRALRARWQFFPLVRALRARWQFFPLVKTAAGVLVIRGLDSSFVFADLLLGSDFMIPEGFWVPLLFAAGIVLVIFVVGALITLPFLLIFGLIGKHVLQRSKQASAVREASQSWPSTYGTVIKSRVEVRGGDHTSVEPYVAYAYSVGGRDYENHCVRAGDAFLAIYTSRHAYDTIDRYPEGAEVAVYYNPDNPAESVLER